MLNTYKCSWNKSCISSHGRYEDGWTILSLDELTTLEEILLIVHSQYDDIPFKITDISKKYEWLSTPMRKKPWLQQEVFTKYQSETNMMRYINELVQKDFSLVNGMMPLGSCTMKSVSYTHLTLPTNREV